MIAPHITVVGAGPAGLLCAICLASRGIAVTLLEKSLTPDPWSTRSYSINLNPRGLGALEKAGVLPKVKSVGMERKRVVMESFDGKQMVLPRDPPHLSVSRPALVECLQEIVENEYSDYVKIQRGVPVKHVLLNKEGVEVHLDNDDPPICSTHVIAADGKWSAVRSALSEFDDMFEIQTEPCFGVLVTPPDVTPSRWATDATSVFRPNDPSKSYYTIVSPLPGGMASMSMVCFEQIAATRPWLVPRDENQNMLDWESDYGSLPPGQEADKTLQENLATMLQEELPLVFQDLGGEASCIKARINRRTSWLKPKNEDKVCYSDSTGRIALIGDAAHAMTPSVGEGCNCALESVMFLMDLLLSSSSLEATTKDDKPSGVNVDALTKAFLQYGAQRPPQVIPVQSRSAEGNRYKTPQTSRS